MQKFNVDVQRPSVPLVVYAKQQDTVRKVELTLYENGVPFVPPVSSIATVWYKTPAGEGNYDATISGNKIEITLIEQMLGSAGNGIACVVLHDVDKAKLGLWNMEIVIEGVPALDSAVASEWFTALDDKIAQALDAADRAENAAATVNPSNFLDVPTYKGSAVGIVKSADSAKSADVAKNINRKNLLDNWYFINPVNQRKINGSFSSAGQYFIDRWILESGTVNVTSGGLNLNGVIKQKLEFPVGATTTASVKGAGTASYDDSAKEFKITGNGLITAAKLEIGGFSTLDNDARPNFAEELAKCQRFYERIYWLAGANGTVLDITVPFKVQKRTSAISTTMIYSRNGTQGNASYYGGSWKDVVPSVVGSPFDAIGGGNMAVRIRIESVDSGAPVAFEYRASADL